MDPENQTESGVAQAITPKNSGPTLRPFDEGLGRLLIMLAVMLGFWTAYFPVRFSNDPWWHIKSGQVFYEHFREHSSFPTHDLFTLRGDEVPWIHHEWLSDMLIYGVYSAVGLPGLVMVKSLGIAALAGLIVWVLRRRGCSPAWAAVGGLFAILMSQVSLFLRPHLLTYGFIVIWMELMGRLKNSPKPMRIVWIATGMEVLWINLHGGGILGIVLTAIALMEEVWWWIVGAPGDVNSVAVERRRSTVLCFAFVTLASFCNPYGYQIHLLPGVVLNDSWLMRLIGELDPPNLKAVLGLRIILFVSIGFLLTPKLRARPFEVLALLFFALQGSRHVRHIPLLAVSAAVVLPPVIQQATDWIVERMKSHGDLPQRLAVITRRFFTWRLDALVAFLLVGYTMGYTLAGSAEGGIWNRNWQDRGYAQRLGYWPGGYPEGAVNYLLYHNLEGPMFHDDNFAGYLIYRLAPERMRVYTDSRYDLFGSVYAKEQLAVRGVSTEPFGLYADDGVWFDLDTLGISRNPYEQNDEQRQILWRSAAEQLNAPDGLAWIESGKPYWKWVLDDKYNFNLVMLYRNNDRLEGQLRQPDSGWKVAYEDGNPSAGYVLFERDAGNSSI